MNWYRVNVMTADCAGGIKPMTRSSDTLVAGFGFQVQNLLEAPRELRSTILVLPDGTLLMAREVLEALGVPGVQFIRPAYRVGHRQLYRLNDAIVRAVDEVTSYPDRSLREADVARRRAELRDALLAISAAYKKL